MTTGVGLKAAIINVIVDYESVNETLLDLCISFQILWSKLPLLVEVATSLELLR